MNDQQPQNGYRRGICVAVIVLFFVTACNGSSARDLPVTDDPIIVQPTKTSGLPVGAEMIEPTSEFEVTQMEPSTVQIEPRAPNEACPNLGSRLYALWAADDPQGFAEAQGIFIQESYTRVVVDLVEPGGDLSFLLQYQIETETQTDSLVQALVPIPMLCDLSNAPQVNAVSEPRNAIIP